MITSYNRRSGPKNHVAISFPATGNVADLRSPTNLALLTELLHDRIIPLVAAPKVDITGVTTSGVDSAGDHTAQIIQALRMIGVVG